MVRESESLQEYGVQAWELDGDRQCARGWFEAAYGAAERAGAEPAMAAATLGWAGPWLDEHRTAASWGLLRARLNRSADVTDPASVLAARLRVRLAGELDYRRGECRTVLAALDSARAAVPDPAVRSEALAVALHCLLGPDHGPLRRALAEEALGAAALSGRRSDLLTALLFQCVGLFLDGDPQARRHLVELRDLLEPAEHLAVGYVARAVDVMLAVRAGRLDDVDQLARDCFERGVKAADPNAAAWQATHRITVAWYQGTLPRLLPAIAGLVDQPVLSTVDHSVRAWHAVAAATAGQYAQAESILAALCGGGLGRLPRSCNWLVTMYGIVEAANLLQDATVAAEAYEVLEPFGDLPMTGSFANTCFGSAHHALGVAALTTGDPDRAVSHLDRAVDRNLALAHWPAVRASRLRYAEALARRGRPGDPDAAQELLGKDDDLTRQLNLSLPPRAHTVTWSRHGRKWRIGLGGRTAVVDHAVGMLHLAVLLANPGVDIPATDLVTGVDALAAVARNSHASAQPILDAAAMQSYRQRLTELRDRADDAAAGAEAEWLAAELAGGTRPNGRPRTFVDNAERARVAASKAIRRAIDRIEQSDAVVGAHLRAAVHTGVHCWYRPLGG